MSKNRQPKVVHIISVDVPRDKHGGQEAMCGAYIRASANPQTGSGNPACMGCVMAVMVSLEKTVQGDARRNFDSLQEAFVTDIHTVHGRIDDLAHGPAAWIPHYDEATLRIERLERDLAKTRRRLRRLRKKA